MKKRFPQHKFKSGMNTKILKIAYMPYLCHNYVLVKNFCNDTAINLIIRSQFEKSICWLQVSVLGFRMVRDLYFAI